MAFWQLRGVTEWLWECVAYTLKTQTARHKQANDKRSFWGKFGNLRASVFSMFLFMAGAAPRPSCILSTSFLPVGGENNLLDVYGPMLGCGHGWLQLSWLQFLKPLFEAEFGSWQVINWYQLFAYRPSMEALFWLPSPCPVVSEAKVLRCWQRFKETLHV